MPKRLDKAAARLRLEQSMPKLAVRNADCWGCGLVALAKECGRAIHSDRRGIVLVNELAARHGQLLVI